MFCRLWVRNINQAEERTITLVMISFIPVWFRIILYQWCQLHWEINAFHDCLSFLAKNDREQHTSNTYKVFTFVFELDIKWIIWSKKSEEEEWASVWKERNSETVYDVDRALLVMTEYCNNDKQYSISVTYEYISSNQTANDLYYYSLPFHIRYIGRWWVANSTRFHK